MGKRAQWKRQNKKARRPAMGKRPTPATTVAKVGAQIPRSQVSLRTAITAAPRFPDGRETNPSGGPGDDACVYVLGKPGAEGFVAGIDVEEFINSGASLLLMPPGIAGIEYELTIEGTTYKMVLEANAQHEAARVRASVTADDLLNAEALAYDNILPIVSLLGFTCDVGVEVRGWVVTEDATGLQRVRVGLLGETRMLRREAVRGDLTQEARMLLATYREASSSSNLFLQALSYWKVIEGVYALRGRAAQDAKDRGQEPTRWARERVPDDISGVPYRDAWALEGFRPFLGKRFTAVRDELRDRLRNGLAHLLPGDKNIRSLTADVFNDLAICEEAIPVLRYMARTLLTNQLAAQQQPARVLPI